MAARYLRQGYGVVIRDVLTEDLPGLTEIYNYYIENETATFEEQTVSEQEMGSRLKKVESDGLPWLVAVEGNTVLGYAYACKWKSRSAYRYSVEISVYLDNTMRCKGLGTQLYAALFEKLKATPIHTVIGGITLPNPVSVALHEKFGLIKVAHFNEVGYKFGKRQDVGYWQAILDRENE